MIYWLLQHVLRRGFKSRRGNVRMGEVEDLARSGTAAWALAQERARLQYLAAKENYEKHRSWRDFEQMMERLLQLHSTNALVQALINEHLLAQMIVNSPDPSQTPATLAARSVA